MTVAHRSARIRFACLACAVAGGVPAPAAPSAAADGVPDRAVDAYDRLGQPF